ncbi:MAG: nucleoside monophosphate kinase [Candidatus Pacebacteria bacterium]|nr:nucleoside monophosphate kinase [Candidatus Paceibacterota bacterium]
MDKQTLIFLGTQGSGKGTQIGLAKEWLVAHDATTPIVHFEMGKNLRELSTRQDYTGKLANEILLGGNLIPYAISSAVFAQYLMNNMHTGDEHIFIDGFPRTADQVPTLDSAMDYYGRKQVTVVVLNISDEEAVKRLLPRGRADDTEEGIRKRLSWSREQTMPNIKWFKEHPERYKVVEVFGERPIEEVQADIRKLIGFV